MIGFRSESVVALGANLPSQAGPPAQTLCRAIAAMRQAGLKIRAVSRFFATPCFPAGAGPDYVNAALRIETRMAPHDLLICLHEIEASLGRERAGRWGMRTLDLDVICIGDLVLPDAATVRKWMQLAPEAQARETPQNLILPHPRLQDRAFVLVPMADVAPDWRHPLTGLRVHQLVAALPAAEIAAVRPL